MNCRNQINRFPMIFPMVMTIFLGLAQLGCDNSGEANIVTRRGKAGQGGPEKPTKETGIVPASHAAMGLTSVRQVLRIVDLAHFKEHSVHFDKKCQSLKSEAVDDSTTRLTVSVNERGCQHNWSGEEVILVTKKNDVISKIEKVRGRGITLEILERGNSDIEVKIADNFTLERLEGLEYRVRNYDGNFTVTEVQGERENANKARPSRTLVSDSVVAFSGKFDLTDAQNPKVEIESILNDWMFTLNNRKAIIIKSVITSANETSSAPVGCLWPLGFYKVQQESDKHTGVFVPVVTVTNENRILAPNARHNYEGRACQNGLLGLQETLFSAGRLTHQSAREGSSAMGGAGGSTYGKRSGSRGNNNSDNDDDSDKKDGGKKANKKKNKKTSPENNT